MHSPYQSTDNAPDLIRVLDSLSAGALVLSDQQQQALSIGVQEALRRLVQSFRVRLEAASSSYTRDEMTGMLSPTTFRGLVTESLSQRARPAAMLSITLEGVQRVNDAYGHLAGDQLLTLAASRISSLLDTSHLRFSNAGEGPLVCRAGGSVFIAFIQVANEADALRTGYGIRDALSEPFFVAGHTVLTSTSIGVAVAPDHGRYYGHLLRHADLAMREARLDKRGVPIVFESGIADRAQNRASMETMLREALVKNQFELHFQPQFRTLAEAALPNVEALLRWRHPIKGLIPPASFLPLAEESGFMCEIGQWVLSTATQTAARWAALGRPCRIAVNVSAVELGQPDFSHFTQKCLSRSGLIASNLVLEITESSMINAEDITLDHLLDLQSLGVGISIDDFGIGYSNFARLGQLPFDQIKIDRSLVRRVLNDPTQREVVKCIVGMSKALGREVVVEGIESKAQVDLFCALGCDLLQGFHISVPLPDKEALKWLETFPVSTQIDRAA